MGVFTAINDPSVYFQQLLYTGNGSSGNAQTNTGNSNLQPDWLWIKNVSATENHQIFDSSRGVTKRLYTDLNYDEDDNNSTNFLQSFNTDGFTVGTDSAVNGNGNSILAYQWKVNGGTEVANTTKSINADIQVNNTAGISIIKYTGNETGSQTLPHGLSAPWWNGADGPSALFIKSRGSNGDWHVCQSPNANYYGGWGDDSGYPRTMVLNENYYAGNGSVGTDGNAARYRADMDATTIYLGHDSTYNGTGGMIAYCFKNVPGFSHFSGYVGNGSADGPEIFLGFKPGFLMFKRWNDNAGWAAMVMQDGEPIVYKVRPDTSDAQGNPSAISVTSSGFKIVSTSSDYNTGGGRYAYWAWADQPLVTSTGIPSMAGITGGSG